MGDREYEFIDNGQEKAYGSACSVERYKEYRALEADLKEEAKRRNCSVNDLRLAIDYPEEIEW